MPKISLSGPAELLTAIPFHLGFRPERSVVALCLHGRRLGLVARLDAVPAGAARDAAEQVAPTLLGEAPSSVLLVGFDTDDGESRPLLDALRLALRGARGVGATEVAERLVVHDGRWYGIDCTCCPAPGPLLPRGVDVPAVAGYVAVGGSVLDSRLELCRVLEPAGPASRGHDEHARAIDEWLSLWEAAAPIGDRAPLVRDVVGAWGALVRGDLDDRLGLGAAARRPNLQAKGLEPGQLAPLVAALVDTEVRDLLVGWLCPGTLPLDGLPPGLVDELRQLPGPSSAVEPSEPSRVPADEGLDEGWDAWQEAGATRVMLSRLEALCRLTPVAHAVPLLSVVATYAWWCGDGARASVAVDWALELDPGHRMCQLIRRSLDHGLRLRAG